MVEESWLKSSPHRCSPFLKRCSYQIHLNTLVSWGNYVSIFKRHIITLVWCSHLLAPVPDHHGGEASASQLRHQGPPWVVIGLLDWTTLLLVWGSTAHIRMKDYNGTRITKLPVVSSIALIFSVWCPQGTFGTIMREDWVAREFPDRWQLPLSASWSPGSTGTHS